MEEQQLAGGVANAGSVVRVGEHVLRPSNPHSRSVHRFLSALRAAGFDGASSPVGIDEDGRERLEFIDGDVPVPPFPDWAQSDTALESIAALLAGLHDPAQASSCVDGSRPVTPTSSQCGTRWVAWSASIVGAGGGTTTRTGSSMLSADRARTADGGSAGDMGLR